MTACSLLLTPTELTSSPESELDAIRADQWVLAIRRGEEAAFDALVQHFQARLHRFCWRWLNCAEEARDVAQETFVRAWFALEGYECRGKFSAWLFRIALNLCRDRSKTRAAQQQRRTVSLAIETAGTLACAQPTPMEASMQASDFAKLQEGLRELPEKFRLPLILCTLEGHSQKDAALIIGCSTRAVEGRLRRGREALQVWWGQRS
jgi:RNA polymerase sigma factor (sigma-70 family)